MHHPDALANPCINICRMDLANRYCQGCARTRLEIGRWARMSEAERAQVLAAVPARRAIKIHTT
ncbi:DUF1289 domain-containing protein [Cupriavidus taiwanensis]|uniref:Fe-S protein n=1 Tax=Cupriavidus taiwanensis TaxID=164546 RepID=A0A375HP21_9BURK|nr:DUF1289 domain-containing protein [Cupriavidus taiwanensis]SOY59551.1 hypothetical protein CBM2588_B10202 [Cupriavidus taiwanensis]SOY59943.1 hypothetical protein CBM2592_B10207 [Cupriavidus taiwanensis]SOY91986.1 hypothetical protein CBM2591_B10205 [Cupriavidus taiwanensis]SOZ26832.1 hypothetical protein CBM2608_B10002 [Cupriavidus taiwanensis]SOZ65849.1 hypothetical protein CBM2617_B10048 [Cupriavidus taiwanensis]